jgi:hypothetical protein
MRWDEAYADRYDEWSANMTADIPFYVGLASRSDGPLVELAVGNGRVAVPVARATGQRVIGIDRSPAMVTKVRLNAARAGVDIELREGDMRDLVLAEPAALIYCPSVRSCICRPGPAAAVPSSGSPPRYDPGDGSPGTPSPSTTGSRPKSTRPPGRPSSPHDSVPGRRQSSRYPPRRRLGEFAVVGYQE